MQHKIIDLKEDKFINLLTDYGFKLVFGTDANKDVLIAFLNALLAEHQLDITDLIYTKNEYHGINREHRKAIYDIACTGGKGEKLIIEVQRIEQDHFRDRALFYASRMIHEQAMKGRPWDYRIDAVYFIGILDFPLAIGEQEAYIRNFQLTEKKTGETLTEKLHFVFVELPHFKKNVNELSSELDTWLYLLRDLHRLKKIPVTLDNSIFKKVFTMAEVAKMTKEEYDQYERSLQDYWDERGWKNLAIKQGWSQGLEEGRVEGRVEGREEGRADEKLAIARQMLISGKYDDSEIAELTGLDVAYISKLR